jgi:hypothetical protein
VVKGVAVGGSDRRIRGRRRLLTRRPESAGRLVQGEASISRWLVKKYLLRGFAIFDASETGLLSRENRRGRGSAVLCAQVGEFFPFFNLARPLLVMLASVLFVLLHSDAHDFYSCVAIYYSVPKCKPTFWDGGSSIYHARRQSYCLAFLTRMY